MPDRAFGIGTGGTAAKMPDEAPTCMRPNSVREIVVTKPINQLDISNCPEQITIR